MMKAPRRKADEVLGAWPRMVTVPGGAFRGVCKMGAFSPLK